MRSRLLLLLCLVACGAPSTNGAPATEGAAGTGDDRPPTRGSTGGSTGTGGSGAGPASGSSGTTSAPVPTPASFAACRALPIDCEGSAPAPACVFPEGTCACEVHYRCSGVPPAEGEPNAWREWTCRETPPAVRADGCPGLEPSDGAPCDGRASFCTYGDCAFVPYECVGGVWRRGMASAPPSAAP